MCARVEVGLVLHVIIEVCTGGGGAYMCYVIIDGWRWGLYVLYVIIDVCMGGGGACVCFNVLYIVYCIVYCISVL